MLNENQIDLARHIAAHLADREFKSRYTDIAPFLSGSERDRTTLRLQCHILPYVVLHFENFCSLVDCAASNPTFTNNALGAAAELLAQVEREAKESEN